MAVPDPINVSVDLSDSSSSSSGDYTNILEALEAETTNNVVDTSITLELANNEGMAKYGEDTTILDLSAFSFTDRGELVIMAADFNMERYENGENPFNDEEDKFDPESAPMPVIAPVIIPPKAKVTIIGLAINHGPSTSSFLSSSPTVVVDKGADLVMKFCRVNGNNNCGLYINRATATIENSFILDALVGVYACDSSNVSFVGNNVILNSVNIGVSLLGHATMGVYPWGGENMTYCLAIMTDRPRSPYTAVKAEAHSLILLDYCTPGMDLPMPGILAVLRGCEIDSEEYLGVVIESMSALRGAKNVKFYVPDEGEQVDTITSGRQIIVATE